MSGAGEAPVVAVVTGSVLQTEAGLVALGHHMVGVGIQQVVVAELIHAVEVSVDQSSRHQSDEECRHLVCVLRQKTVWNLTWADVPNTARNIYTVYRVRGV